MTREGRRLRLSPALVIACLALFVSLGGVGYAAVKLKANSVKTKTIKNGAVTEPKIGNGAVTTPKFATSAIAPNAAKLGGELPTGYQEFCEAGAIKGTLVASTLGFTSSTYVDVTGFNCFQPGNTTTSVQMRKLFDGQYLVRFVGNSGPNASGSAVSSLVTPVGSLGTYTVATTDAQAPGETVFLVRVLDAGSSGVNSQTFSLLAF